MRFTLMSDNQGKAPAGWASHAMLKWSEWEPKRGSYNYALVDKALNAADRPCYLQVGFSAYNKALKLPEDYTPAQHRRSLGLTGTGGAIGYVPDYSTLWVEAYCQAVAALAERYRTHPRVAGYWHAAGWNQETQAAVDNAGGAWATQLRPLLAEQDYLDFLLKSTRAALNAWSPAPVYLPGAPSPGALWGHRRRDIIATLLEEGCGYMNCALVPDIQDSFGVGAHAGTGMYDIVVGRTARRGFEEGPRRALKNPDELYWQALRAWHWDADFVSVYSALSAPQVAQVAPRLPTTARALVWRDSEYPPITWTGADKQVYGKQGEPGCWAKGLAWRGGGQLRLDATRYDFGRWQLVSADPVQLAAPNLADGRYRVIVYAPPQAQSELVVTVKDALFELPAGTYHRVDLAEPALAETARMPLPEDEPEATVSKVRFWLEQEAREREAGNGARADAILYSNIQLAYRVEGVTPAGR